MEKLSCDLNPALKPTGMQKFMAAFGVIAIMLLFALTFVFATGEAEQDIVNGIQDGMNRVYSILTTIMIPIAAVVLAWCAFKVLFGGEKGMQQAKNGILTIIIVIALVWIAPLIITSVSEWFNGIGSGTAFSQEYTDPVES